MPAKPRAKRPNYWLRLLVLVPFIALGWVPFYNRTGPELFGIPFFYWYQLSWIVIGALLLALVYVAEEPSHREDAR
jgi:hypothetical protein